MRKRSLPAWPFGACAAALATTSWVLSLQAVVTFPTALAAGALVALGLARENKGVSLGNYGLCLGVSLLSALATFAWQRAGS